VAVGVEPEQQNLLGLPSSVRQLKFVCLGPERVPDFGNAPDDFDGTIF